MLNFLRGVEHRGSDVRLDTGCQMRPNVWPRQSLDPDLWIWQTAAFYPWKQEAHINELEARACLAQLKWRARSVAHAGTRCLHLLDSGVTIGVLNKKRSSSRQLNRVIKRFDVLELASAIQCSFGFVRSERNPADKPSRVRYRTVKKHGKKK